MFPTPDDVARAGPQRPEEFPAADDVEPGTHFAQLAQQGEVSVALDAVADQGIALGERVAQQAEMALDRSQAVDERGRPATCGDLGRRDVFGVQFVISVRKPVDGSLPSNDTPTPRSPTPAS